MIEPIRKPTPKKRETHRLRSKLHVIPSSVKQAVFARVPGGALDPHHRFSRAAGGRDTAHTLISVHRVCHRAIHDNPQEARRRRFTVRSEAELVEAVRG